MLGMFIILPVFALYAETLPGGRDHTLVGIALGAYGLTQALLQVPFGWASDRWGRKPVDRHRARHLRARQLRRRVGADDRLDDRRPQPAGRRRDLRRGDRAHRRSHARLGAHARDGRHRHDHRRHVRAVARRGPALTALIGVPGIFALTGVLALAAIASAAAHGGRPSTIDRAARARRRRNGGACSSTAAAAPQLRHLRAACRADGAVHAGAVHAARQRPRRRASTGSSTCRCSWRRSR